MTEIPHPNYAELIDAMATRRATWTHKVCLDRRLVGAVQQAKRHLEQAIAAKEDAEALGVTRRKMGHVSPIDQARQALTLAEAERDANSLAFILSPPTAEEEQAALEAEGVGEQMPIWQARRITLAAAWQRTETLDGDPVPWIDRGSYARALAAMSVPELIGAHSGLMSVAADPDFS